MSAEFARVARALTRERLEGSPGITEEDLLGDLDRGGHRPLRFLGFYTAEGMEYALSRYGILRQLRRLGYGGFRVRIDRDERGDRFRLFANAEGREHLLIEVVLEKRRMGDDDVLYVHWLTLRHPRGRFSAERPRLPGQEEPGLGMAREAGHLLARTAERLHLAGIVFRPAWYHTAYAARFAMSFIDPAQQGRFEAMQRDFCGIPLREVTQAMAEGRVQLDGRPYRWEAGEMGYFLDQRPADRARIEAVRDSSKFSIVPLNA
jgi:hypothetical protein